MKDYFLCFTLCYSNVSKEIEKNEIKMDLLCEKVSRSKNINRRYFFFRDDILLVTIPRKMQIFVIKLI